MCAIIGAVLYGVDSPYKLEKVNDILLHIFRASQERGRDGWGYSLLSNVEDVKSVYPFRCESSESFPSSFIKKEFRNCVFIANLRAEPTTEFVENKRPDDQQPYNLGVWSVVHNGTIANDGVLRTNLVNTKIDSAAIVEGLNANSGDRSPFLTFEQTVRELKGSYAILSTHFTPKEVFFACNYRPIWYISTEYGYFFASSERYFPKFMDYNPVMVAPYTFGRVTKNGVMQYTLLEHKEKRKALVICSGGLDSVVSAVYAQKKLGMEITLLHFLYGSKAERRERYAVASVAKELKVPYIVKDIPFYDKADSNLLNPDCEISGGEEGSEFAHEWVPARNLVLLSLATAYAEAKGYDALILGNNLEEAGAYPDNEPEFIRRFNGILPFAIRDGKSLEVLMPVGNLMKHEIVKLGDELGAPMHLTWSCYKNGPFKHCGKCGPCYMRRKAFRMNNLKETICYQEEE